MKQFFKNTTLVLGGIALAAGSMVFAATWQGATDIQDGQIIQADTLRENFTYLYERSWDFLGDSDNPTHLLSSQSVAAPEYCDETGTDCINMDYTQVGQMAPSALPLSEAQSICGGDQPNRLNTRSGVSGGTAIVDGRFVLAASETFHDSSWDGNCGNNTCTLSNYGSGWEVTSRSYIYPGDCR